MVADDFKRPLKVIPVQQALPKYVDKSRHIVKILSLASSCIAVVLLELNCFTEIPSALLQTRTLTRGGIIVYRHNIAFLVTLE